jgi:hypothetical protein
MKGHEQGLDKTRLGLKGREAPIRQVHELGDISIDADAAGARSTGHRAVLIGRKNPGDRFPANHVAFEQAQSSRVRPAAVKRDVDELSEHITRVLRERVGEDL